MKKQEAAHAERQQTNGRLEGKIALITGGSSGIGLATARRFVAEGAYVYIIGRRQEQLDEAVAYVGKNVTAISGDTSKEAELDKVFSIIHSAHNHLDIVFANAGVGSFEPLGKITDEKLSLALDTNIKGTVFTVQKAIAFMKAGGSIILTGSSTGIKGMAAFSVYGATKAAIRNFARSRAIDLKGTGIRINVLSPGSTNTPGLFELLDSTGFQEQALKKMSESSPIGRVGNPDEIAAVALFLASDDSSFMTGGEIFADGGLAQI